MKVTFTYWFNSQLEVQFQAKLKLSGVKRRRWAAVIAAVAGALTEVINVAEERRRRSFVKAIEHVEALGNEIQPDALAKPDGPNNLQIKRRKLMRDTHVASKAAAGEEWRQHERAAGINAGSIVRTLLIAIGVNAGDDIEGTSGAHFQKRSDGEIR